MEGKYNVIANPGPFGGEDRSMRRDEEIGDINDREEILKDAIKRLS